MFKCSEFWIPIPIGQKVNQARRERKSIVRGVKNCTEIFEVQLQMTQNIF
jgi:hypothetical protein